MNEAWNVPENGYSISRLALWAWILSFGYTLGGTFVRIALRFQGGEQGVWPLSVLAAAAAIAFLLHLRRDRRAALALSIGVGVYELLNQGLYLYSFYFANEDPESLRRMLHLFSSGHWWVYRCLWLPLLAGGYLALRRNRRAWPLLCIGAAGALYQLADLPFLRYFLTYSPQYGELRFSTFSTITAFEAFDVMSYASVIAAFLFAYLDARSSRPVRFDELGSNQLGRRPTGGVDAPKEAPTATPGEYDPCLPQRVRRRRRPPERAPEDNGIRQHRQDRHSAPCLSSALRRIPLQPGPVRLAEDSRDLCLL